MYTINMCALMRRSNFVDCSLGFTTETVISEELKEI